MHYARRESWQAYRRKMIRQTEVFIEYYLRHPEEVIPIPVKPARDGAFPAAVGRWFWNTVLRSNPTRKARRWREFFRGRRFELNLRR
ncbi:MAG: hypothetical protein ACOC8F_08025 [Planctomycetota bacterium]